MGYDSGAVESREARRRVRENDPWVSSKAAGALAVFYHISLCPKY